MASVPRVAAALQQVLTATADTAGRTCGVIQRQRKFSGASLCQTLVFGWLAHPTASLSDLCGAATDVGVVISKQGIDQRLKGAGAQRLAAMMRLVLEAAVEQVVASDTTVNAVLARFSGVLVEDTSIISLPQTFADVWQGCGGVPGTSEAALKLVVRWNLRTGQLIGPHLASGRIHDGVLADDHPLPAASLYLADLGSFGLARFARLDAAGVFYLSRLRAGTTIMDGAGHSWRPSAFLQQCASSLVDQQVQLGVVAHLPVRLLAVRLPQQVADERRRRLGAAAQREGRTLDADTLQLCSWTVLITNVPSAHLTLKEALALARARWQIELIWKLWKSDGGLATSRSAQPEHILVELYAKLIGMLVQHWVMLTIPVSLLAISRVKLAALVRSATPALARTFLRGHGLHRTLRAIRAAVHPDCRLTTHKAHPSTHRRLSDPELCLN
jgi:hypothetical protein